jgi:hypothetical protein
MAKQIDFAAQVAGITVAVFGVVLLLDADGSVRVHLQAIWPIATFMVGATLLALGLTRRN